MFNKTCQICSIAFESKAFNAKYCPECRKDVKNWRRQDARKREAAEAKKQEEKKPFPKIRLNKQHKSELLKSVNAYLCNRYPAPSIPPVQSEIERTIARAVPNLDRTVLSKYGEVCWESAGFWIRKETVCDEDHYFLGYFLGRDVEGTKLLCISVPRFFGRNLFDEEFLKRITYDDPTIVEYARECEIWNCEIQKAFKAWKDIIENTTWVNHLPEEARPFVEEVFTRKVERDKENLAIIRRFDKED